MRPFLDTRSSFAGGGSAGHALSSTSSLCWLTTSREGVLHTLAMEGGEDSSNGVVALLHDWL